jgi:pimeloyl-ACP methyl ester carboxylesterase
MKKGTKKFLFLTSAAVAGMYAYNKYVSVNSTKNNMLPTKDGAYYSWKQGNVFYTKSGSGSPVLLVHDTNSASSSVEWSKITTRLRRNHTVYTIDLLGCGLSDKPGVSYTNYMYVQLITAFIKNVIKEKTDVVASNMSGSFVIMANHMDDSIINRIILINPISMKVLEAVPDDTSKLKQILINLPIVGTFLYNLLTSPASIDHRFRSTYYSRTQLISEPLKEAFYESAHMDNSSGKYLYSSILGNYMNVSIRHAVENCKNQIFIVGSKDITNNLNTIEEYRELNPQISVIYISNCKLYPQLENPEKTYQIIQAAFQK